MKQLKTSISSTPHAPSALAAPPVSLPRPLPALLGKSSLEKYGQGLLHGVAALNFLSNFRILCF